MTWSPAPALVRDVQEAIDDVPVRTADDRFEALAWSALLTTEGARLLTRDCAPCHVTASAIVLSPDGRQTCLVLHSKLRSWVQPGGHLEDGDRSIAAAAAREVREETGLEALRAPTPLRLSRHTAPCAPGVVDWHLDVQYVLVSDAAAPAVSEESLDVAWWPVDALPSPLALGIDEAVRVAVAATTAR